MKQITYLFRPYEIPEHVNEVTPAIYRRLLALSAGEYPGPDEEMDRLKESRVLLTLMGKNTAPDMLTPSARYEIDRLIEDGAVDGFFFKSADNGRKYIDLSTPLNKLPVYIHGEKEYKGPSDWLGDLTFGQFIEILNLMSSLGSDTTADDYIEVTQEVARIMYGIPAADSVPTLLLFHVPLLFKSVWHKIESGPVEIDGNMIDFRIIFRKSGNTKPDDKTGWNGILFEVATAGLFGPVEQVKQTPFWEVLLYLYKCKFEYIHQEKQSK